MDSIKCICCNKAIERLPIGGIKASLIPEENNWNNGAVNAFCCSYGSRHDDNMYLFGICDDCIFDKLDRGIILDITDREIW